MFHDGPVYDWKHWFGLVCRHRAQPRPLAASHDHSFHGNTTGFTAAEPPYQQW
jgi:hypothetical protein